jgi:hypothetical protein
MKKKPSGGVGTLPDGRKIAPCAWHDHDPTLPAFARSFNGLLSIFGLSFL